MSAVREFPRGDPIIFPAVDVRGGRCVRLVRGARDAEIPYGDSPRAAAERFVAAGASCLHVIDLGAALGEAHSAEVLCEIATEVDVPVQAGGGLRDEASVARLLEGGVARVILGTRAFRDPDFLARMVDRWGPRRIVVGLDCDGDRVKVAGWEEESALNVASGLELVTAAGVEHLLVTAIDRDGTLAGARLELLARVLEEGRQQVVAAGGIGELAHIRDVLDLGHPRLEGVVVGRALYEGTVKIEEALELTKEMG